MFREGSPIAYDAPADLKKWPSLNGQRLNGGRQPYLVFNGTLAECIRELMAKPVKQISLYDIVTEPQPMFDRPVLSPGDAAEIAMRKDFPKGNLPRHPFKAAVPSWRTPSRRRREDVFAGLLGAILRQGFGLFGKSGRVQRGMLFLCPK